MLNDARATLIAVELPPGTGKRQIGRVNLHSPWIELSGDSRRAIDGYHSACDAREEDRSLVGARELLLLARKCSISAQDD